MGCNMNDFEKYCVDLVNFRVIWTEWADSQPSLKHPIKYIKWYFSEPKYGKETNK